MPLFAGFYSKDVILESAWGAHSDVGNYAFWLGIAAAVLTAFYSWRLLFLTFHGAPRADAKVMAHVHESPRVMTFPLIFLAAGAVFAGMLASYAFVGGGMEGFWRDSILILPEHPSLENAHHAPFLVKALPVVVGIAGIALAYVCYIMIPGLPGVVSRIFKPLYVFLYRKWFFDELYDWLFVFPANYLGRGLWRSGDGALIDGVGPDGVAAATRNIARRASRLQTGYIYHYAFAMLIGVVIFVTWYLFARAG